VSAPARERKLGEIVGGKYRVVRFLAAGGMGVVYEAQHTVVRRRFAVKFLRPDLAEKRDSLARFQREAEAAGALESENLTAAVDFGISVDGSPFIVMEYLSGESVESLLAREGRVPLGRAADLVVQACRGIQAAHASGIVHRDLKPQNLFVCRREDGTDLLKVLDFGIAKLEAADQKSAATLTGTVLGTPAYMSPEQARGEKTVDHRADVYALGAILYELVSGKKPHPGDSHNAILHHIASQPAVPLHSVEPNQPAELVRAVSRALSSSPGERFETAELFGQAIVGFAKRDVWPEVKSAVSNPGIEASAPTELAGDARERAKALTNDIQAAPTPRSSAPRARAGPAIALVLSGAGVLAVLWLAFSGTEERPDSVVESKTPAQAPVEVTAPATPIAAPASLVSTHGPSLPASVAPEPPQAKSTDTRAPASKPASTAGRTRAVADAPAAAKSGTPLAFDRKNPYD
jgi:eukaryotic-like serine/threonine-protein kinase